MPFNRKYGRRFKRRKLGRIYRRRNRYSNRKNYKIGRAIGRVWNRIRKGEIIKRKLDFLNGEGIDNEGYLGYPTDIEKGDQTGERLGRTVKMHSIELYGQLNKKSGVSTTQVMICLVRINGDYLPIPGNLSEFKQKLWNYNNEANEPFSWFRPRVLNHMKEFRIVYKKWIQLTDTYPIKKIRIKIRLGLRRITYQGIDELGTIGTGKYYWFMQSDQPEEPNDYRPQIYGTEIVRYIDS